MNIQVLQFDERVGLGTFFAWLAGMGCQIKTWRADLGQLPTTEHHSPVILLGGYMGVHDRDRLHFLQLTADWISGEVRQGRPVLAICLGAQLLAHALGAEVYSQSAGEKGIRDISVTEDGAGDPLFANLPNPFVSFEWHNDSFALPDGSLHLAMTEECRNQAFRFQNAWGVQFHPEVDERIVAEWCQRTGAGESPMIEFEKHRSGYFQHSKQLLKNFILQIKRSQNQS